MLLYTFFFSKIKQISHFFYIKYILLSKSAFTKNKSHCIILANIENTVKGTVDFLKCIQRIVIC